MTILDEHLIMDPFILRILASECEEAARKENDGGRYEIAAAYQEVAEVYKRRARTALVSGGYQMNSVEAVQ